MKTKAVESGARLPHAWVKVERRGNEGIGYVSADGVEWEEVQRRVIPGFSETVYAGIVAIGNQPTNAVGFDPVDAGVCDVELTGLEPDPEFRRGDADVSGAVNVTDVIVTLGFLTGVDLACDDAADSNDDGTVGVSDAIFTLIYLFDDGVGIPAPGPRTCGTDGTPDELGCEAFAACEA